VPQLQQKLALNVLNIHNTFLYNLQMGPKTWDVTLHLAEKTCQGQTHQLTGPIN